MNSIKSNLVFVSIVTNSENINDRDILLFWDEDNGKEYKYERMLVSGNTWNNIFVSLH